VTGAGEAGRDLVAAAARRIGQQRFPRTPASVQEVRAWLRQSLAATSTDADCIDTVVLLASEIVTNAVVHTRSGDLLVSVAAGSLVEVAVQDESAHSATLRPADLLDTTGRGLHLVNALATAWGTRRTGQGKTVWFRVAATG
jgi:anti-sigma regulatory factor (Ser/Thr protein kinase)